MDQLRGRFFDGYPSKSKGRPFLSLSHGMKFWKLLFFVFFKLIYETADMGMWLIFCCPRLSDFSYLQHELDFVLRK